MGIWGIDVAVEDDFFEHEDDISADALMEASFEHSEDLRVEREGRE